jgi:uncharacterized membrane protein YiaA
MINLIFEKSFAIVIVAIFVIFFGIVCYEIGLYDSSE